MSTSRIGLYVGLDYHRSFVQVCVMNRTGQVLLNRRSPNELREILKAVHPFGRVRRAALESCCGAADLAEALTEAGWSMSLAHPGYVNRMKQSPDKTDYGDSRVLADLCRVGYLPEVWLAPRAVRELRTLVRYRQQWAWQRKAIKTRILALLRDRRIREPGVRRWTRAWRSWLDKVEGLGEGASWVMPRLLEQLAHAQEEINRVEERLDQTMREDRTVQRLLRQPGVGPVTAWTMRAEIGRFDRFANGKQLSRFCGLTPRNCSSGERVADAGLIRAGNPALKALLMEAGHRLMRLDPYWREMAESLRSRGKHVCVIVAAVANRWIRRLHYEMVQPDEEATMI